MMGVDVRERGSDCSMAQALSHRALGKLEESTL